MLKEVTGDITLSEAQVIVHGVAPGDHFNQGLALSLRKLYPSMSKDFRHYCQLDNPSPGEIWTWAGADRKRIVNLMIQEPAPNKQGHPGKASTPNLNSALRELRHLIEQEKFSSIALPKLATGVGGLDWKKDVLPLIERHLGDLNVPIYLYTTFRSGIKAEET